MDIFSQGLLEKTTQKTPQKPTQKTQPTNKQTKTKKTQKKPSPSDEREFRHLYIDGLVQERRNTCTVATLGSI